LLPTEIEKGAPDPPVGVRVAELQVLGRELPLQETVTALA
jgi:hypothetical protein